MSPNALESGRHSRERPFKPGQIIEKIPGSSEMLIQLSDGAVLHTVRRGNPNGIEVLKIDGFPSAAMEHHLPRVYDVDLSPFDYINFSRRGYYRSTGAPLTPFNHPTYWELAQDSAEITAALGVNESYVIARSGGVPHALAYAARYPERVKGLVLLVPGLPRSMGGNPEEVKEPTNHIEDKPAGSLYKHLENLAGRIKRQSTLLPFKLTEFPPGIDPYTIEDIESAKGIDQGSLHIMYQMAIQNGIWGWFLDAWALSHDVGFDLQTVQAPTIIQSYRGDRFTALVGQELQRRVLNSVSFVNSGSHFKAFGDTERYLNVIRAVETGEGKDDILKDGEWARRFYFFRPFG